MKLLIMQLSHLYLRLPSGVFLQGFSKFKYVCDHLSLAYGGEKKLSPTDSKLLNSRATLTETGPKSEFEAIAIEITGMAALILVTFIFVPGT
jgi:hypothetical protein